MPEGCPSAVQSMAHKLYRHFSTKSAWRIAWWMYKHGKLSENIPDDELIKKAAEAMAEMIENREEAEKSFAELEKLLGGTYPEPQDSNPKTQDSRLKTQDSPKFAELNGVEILKTGIFKDSSGIKRDITDVDLAEIIVNFNKWNTAINPSVKIGHSEKQPKFFPDLPDDQQPLMGLIRNVYLKKRDGINHLIADFSDMPDQVAKIIAKYYPRRSVELKLNREVMNNQKIDGWMLEKVSFLGDQFEAVKGLAGLPVIEKLAASDSSCETIIIFFEENNMDEDKTKLSELEDKLKERETKILELEKEIKSLKEKQKVSASEPSDDLKKEVENMKARLDAEEKKREVIETRFAEQEVDTILNGALVKKIPPAMRDSIRNAALKLDNTTVIKFKEGEKEVETTERVKYLNSFNALPDDPKFADLATGDGTETAPDKQKADRESKVKKAAEHGIKFSEEDLGKVDNLNFDVDELEFGRKKKAEGGNE